MPPKWRDWSGQPTMMGWRTSAKYNQMEESTVELRNVRSLNGNAPVQTTLAPWKHAFWRFGPLLGLAAMLASLLCILVAFIILLRSNNDAITNWSIQPSVYLSITATVANALLRFALAQALPIAWWRHALNGRTIKQLHKEWAVGNSIYEALTSWTFLGVASLGCIFCTLLGLVGPLLQKASTVVNTVPSGSLSLTFQMAPELPTGWSGSTGPGVFDASDAFKKVFDDYLQNKPIASNVTGCDGICTAKILGPGLATAPERCTTVTMHLTGENRFNNWPQEPKENYYLLYQTMLVDNTYKNDTGWFGPSSTDVTHPATPDSERESVAIDVLYSEVEDFAGNLTLSQCWFTSAILEYNVVVSENGTVITLYDDLQERPIFALANNTEPLVHYNSTQDVTISNVLESPGVIFTSAYGFAGNSSTGDFIYQKQDLNIFALRQINKNRDSSVFRASNPMPEIVSNLNNIIFRGGVAAASHHQAKDTLAGIDKGLNLTQTVSGQRIDKVSRFRSEFQFWAGASAFQAAAAIFIAVVSWGWWHLGRVVSFSPVEIAKAFDAPVLQNAYSNGGAEGVVEDLGNMRLRYGVQREDLNEDTDSTNSGGKSFDERLVFGRYTDIRPPEKEQRFTA